jgi:hypothetical protein
MSEVKKLTAEELQAVKDVKKEYNDLALSLGELELQKIRLLELQKFIADKEGKLANQLTEKYGQGSINIDTGEIDQ